MTRASDASALAKAERQANAKRVMAAGARAVMAAASAPLEQPCTPEERAAYDGTLLGITHRASHWKRDEDGHLVLVMAPRGGALAGTVAIGERTREQAR